MVTLLMKSPPVSKSVVRRMKPNQTLSSSPRVSLRRATTTSFGCANGHSRSRRRVATMVKFWNWSTRRSVGRSSRHRIRQDGDQGARHLDADGPDDDALDPLFGGESGF